MSRSFHAFDLKRNGPLPPQQQRVVDFIRGCQRFPSPKQIAQHMGWKSEGSAVDCLYRLQWRGVVERQSVEPTERRRALRYAWKLVEPKLEEGRKSPPAEETSHVSRS